MKHITKETAIIIKQIGYNEQVDYFYGIFQDYEGLHKIDNCNNRLNKGQYSAPLQYELKDWLREKYEIHVELTPKLLYPEMIIGSEYYYTIYYKNKEIDDDGVYQYEKALEAGLKHALTLI